jgi:D-xylose 1-dehydrogenase (NADP+, D-xylono-1,5-lactone-forming)
VSGATSGQVGFGFLGAGWIASTALAPAVHAASGAHLQAAAARDVDRAAALGPAGRAYDDYAALLADDDVDVVYVALSNDAHEPWTLAALEAGKHVLCEKPLGLDRGQVQRMTDAAAAADRLLVEAWWYRWHPRTARAVELVRSGALGRVHRVEAEFSFDGDFDGAAAGNYRMDPARGGGAVLDVGCYTVDAARWALQAGALEVVEVEGDVRSGVDVRASARLRPTRTPAPADPASEAPVADVRCGIQGREEQLVAVYGDEATLVLGGASFGAKDVPCSLHLVHTGSGAPGAPAVRTTEEFAPVDPYRLMVEAVAAAVRGEDVWLPHAQDSLDVVTVTDQLRERLHRAPG